MKCIQKTVFFALVGALCLSWGQGAPMPDRLCFAALTAAPDTAIYTNSCPEGEGCSLERALSSRLVLRYCAPEIQAQTDDTGANNDPIEELACRKEWFVGGVPMSEDGITCPEGVSCDLGPMVINSVNGQTFLTFCNEAPVVGDEMPFRGVLARSCDITRLGEATPLLDQPCEAGVECSLGPLVAFFDGSVVEASFCDVTGDGAAGNSSAASDEEGEEGEESSVSADGEESMSASSARR